MVNRPSRRGSLLAVGDELVGLLLQRVEVDVAAVLDLQLEAAGLPRPSIGGARKTWITASSISVGEPLAELLRRSRRRTCRACRGRGTASRMTNDEPKFEPLALSRNDWPAIDERVRDAGDAAACSRWSPGSPRAMRTIWSITARVRCTRGGVGQLHVDQQVALVLRRDERRGRRLTSRSTVRNSRPP